MADNIALEQFRINMMNKGGGLDTGGSTGPSFMDINGFFSELRLPSIEGMKKNIQTTFLKLVGESVFTAMQGVAGQLAPENLGFLGSALSLPHGLIPSSGKVPSGIFSNKQGR